MDNTRILKRGKDISEHCVHTVYVTHRLKKSKQDSIYIHEAIKEALCTVWREFEWTKCNRTIIS